MKRTYTLIVMMMVFGVSTVYAQQADLSSYIDLTQYECLNVGQTIRPDDSVPSAPYGRWGIVNLGPDNIDSGQTVWLSTPFNKMVDSGLYFSGYPTWAAGPQEAVIMLSYLPVDSIKTLVDIDAYEQDTTGYFINFMVSKENLVDSQTYGFFCFAKGVGDDLNSPDNLDTDKTNNYSYVPITWHCGNTESVQELLNASARHITVFPNPAKNTLHFRYGFIKPTKDAQARVIDMTGRILQTKDLGQHHFGTEKFTMDISKLPAGNYLLELSTGYINAVSKFTISK